MVHSVGTAKNAENIFSWNIIIMPADKVLKKTVKMLPYTK